MLLKFFSVGDGGGGGGVRTCIAINRSVDESITKHDNLVMYWLVLTFPLGGMEQGVERNTWGCTLCLSVKYHHTRLCNS